ncbi:MAG: glycosyltransferase family 4 protein [Candidatus Giovannonibacteria bacterium]|nr:glycosyltransferase family 4 protein [Candidatus Giovannonibacteria bacterium]
MKVLMISGDSGVLDSKSETGKRTEEYRQILGTLDVLLAYGSVFRFVGAFFAGLGMLRRGKYDIITAQDAEHSLLAWFFSSLFRVPWQMQIHTDIMSPYFVQSSVLNKMRVWLAKFLVPRADGVRVVSNRIKQSLVKFNKDLDKSDKITVLPVFVDTEKIKSMPVKTDLHIKYPGRFIILMASRITREKNIGLAIEAVSSRLIRENKRITLLVVGDGPEIENLKFKTYKLGLNDSVIFEPRTDDLISYYKTCDLFLLTSNYEGYGMTLVEAASAGVKIVSSDVGIAPEILEPENIFKVGDKNDLAEKLHSALNQRLLFPKPLTAQTKEDYLALYKESLEQCQKIF